MSYMKPQLIGYPAITAVQSVHNKLFNTNEPNKTPTQPAYEADE